MPFPREIDEGRVMRGQEIAKLEGQIKRLDDTTYQVNSQSGHGLYTVIRKTRDWRCSCPDHIYREVKCKHIWAVQFSQTLRKTVSESVVIKPLDMQVCVYCGSNSLVKDGVRHNKNGDIQRFTCKSCGKRFVRNMGFEHLKATPQIVTNALQLYFTGESLRNVRKFLLLQGVQVSHQTIYNWIAKFTGLMERYLDKITPQVSDVWRADELYLKVKGNMKYLFAMMDDETRFWIAQEVADYCTGLPAYTGARRKGFHIHGLSRKNPRLSRILHRLVEKKLLIVDGTHNLYWRPTKQGWVRYFQLRENLRELVCPAEQVRLRAEAG